MPNLDECFHYIIVPHGKFKLIVCERHRRNGLGHTNLTPHIHLHAYAQHVSLHPGLPGSALMPCCPITTSLPSNNPRITLLAPSPDVTIQHKASRDLCPAFLPLVTSQARQLHYMCTFQCHPSKCPLIHHLHCHTQIKRVRHLCSTLIHFSATQNKSSKHPTTTACPSWHK